MFRPITACVAVALTVCFPQGAQAASSTSSGRISVTQVIEMLDRAPADAAARQLLTAYLGGVGEAAGAILDLGGDIPIASCDGRLQLDAATVRAALKAGAGDRAGWNEKAATPLLLRDMLRRANCRLSK